MKKLFSLGFLFFCLFGFSQGNQKENFISIVSYEELSSPPADELKKFPEALQQMAKDHKEVPDHYDLVFNDSESLYKKADKKMEMQQQDEMNNGNIQMKVTKVSVSTTIELYKNQKTKTSVSSRTILGKEFLVLEDVRKIDWELINETKKIGSFECKKAQAKIGGDLVEAWYAPNIPTPSGPGIYWGLPGLIVEVKDRTRRYIATQIKEGMHGKIDVPIKGKKVSKQEFLKLVSDRLNELTKDKSAFRVVNE